MEILLTNDDGIHADGLWALYKCLVRRNEVRVVAPDAERTGVGHGITLNVPIRVRKITVNGGYKGYAVGGTPADCVKLGILELMKKKPDMVISGINPGANLGININYSGTVAAAREAALYGVPAIAVSIHSAGVDKYQDAALFIESFAQRVSNKRLPFGTFLNVNVPDINIDEYTDIRFSRQGLSVFDEYFDKRKDPRNQSYYWLGSDMQKFNKNPEIDGAAFHENCITITPVKCDMTDYSMLDELKKWDISKDLKAVGKEKP